MAEKVKLIEVAAALRAGYQNLKTNPSRAKAVESALATVAKAITEGTAFITGMKMNGVKSVCSKSSDLIQAAEALQSVRTEISTTADRPMIGSATPTTFAKPVSIQEASRQPVKSAEIVPRNRAFEPVVDAVIQVYLSIVQWLWSSIHDYLPDEEEQQVRQADEESEEQKVEKDDTKTEEGTAEEKDASGEPEVKDDNKKKPRNNKRRNEETNDGGD